jgi:serine/threonine protein kinase
MLHHLEWIHSRRYIHGDIKPSNFLVGADLDNEDKVYIIDFGLSKLYRESSGKHMPWSDKNGFHGTPRYASINAHEGAAPSRRDDLESLAYVLVYLIKGKLPWQASHKDETKKEKRRRITAMKAHTPYSELCSGMPRAFQDYLAFVRELSYKEEPDYEHLRNMFRRHLRNAHVSEQSSWRRDLIKRVKKKNGVSDSAFIVTDLKNEVGALAPPLPSLPSIQPPPPRPSSVAPLSAVEIFQRKHHDTFARPAAVVELDPPSDSSPRRLAEPAAIRSAAKRFPSSAAPTPVPKASSYTQKSHRTNGTRRISPRPVVDEPKRKNHALRHDNLRAKITKIDLTLDD